MMILRPILWLLIFSGLQLAGCTRQETPEMPAFRLPEGDIGRGKQAFLELRCNGCHSVVTDDVALDDHRIPHVIELGSTYRSVKTRHQLLTGIIDPSHEFAKGYLPEHVMDEKGRSLMEEFSEKMTVRQMIDLVAYLHSRYEKNLDEYTGDIP